MLRHKPLLLCLLSMITASACSERSTMGDTNGTSPSESTRGTAPTARGATTLDIPVGSGEANAFALAPGSFVSGTFVMPQAARVSTIGVQIGNYGGSADGRLAVDLCQEERCTSGSTAIAGSVDNAVLDIVMSPALDVASGAALRYRVVKADGDLPVAVWLYPPPEGAQPALANGDAPTKGIPRITLTY